MLILQLFMSSGDNLWSVCVCLGVGADFLKEQASFPFLPFVCVNILSTIGKIFLELILIRSFTIVT